MDEHEFRTGVKSEGNAGVTHSPAPIVDDGWADEMRVHDEQDDPEFTIDGVVSRARTTIPGQVVAGTATKKPSNPKDALGIKKAYMSTVPCPVLMELGGAMLEGALKYGRHNYRVIGVLASVYYDAAMRHMMDWWEGQDIDPKSGWSHLVKAMACFTVLRDSQMRGNMVDDRPPPMPSGWLDEINAKTEELMKAYPEPKPAYTK